MIALIDLDSILYSSSYKSTDLNKNINLVEKKILNLLNHINTLGFKNIKSVELYITLCNNNFRNELVNNYKANRTINKEAERLKNYYKSIGAFSSDIFEADDLIANRCKGLNKNDYIILHNDKDLKQIGGYFYSYYMQYVKDVEGKPIVNEYGYKLKEYKQKEVEYISESKANFLFWQQMLTGDKVGNIEGLKGIGLKTSETILLDSKNYFITVAKEYIKRGRRSDFNINKRLLKLGI